MPIRTVTVEFELIPAPPAPTTYTLSTSVSSGNGTIRPASGTYSQGTVVSLSATPGSGYQVKAWHGTNNDSSKSTSNSVTMNANRTVTVEFEPIPAPPEPATNTYTLNVSVANGHGSITAFPSSGPYSQGTMVSLSATPENGYKVKAWTGTDDDTSTADSNTVTMNADHVVTVEFVSNSNPADPEENKGGGGGGGGGCFISTSTSGPLPLSMISLIILLVIVFHRPVISRQGTKKLIYQRVALIKLYSTNNTGRIVFTRFLDNSRETPMRDLAFDFLRDHALIFHFHF